MHRYPADIYTEPDPDPDTLANLGPLTRDVNIDPDGTWSYEQETQLTIPGQAKTFPHTDRNRLHRIGEPTPDPTALAAQLAAKRTPAS